MQSLGILCVKSEHTSDCLEQILIVLDRSELRAKSHPVTGSEVCQYGSGLLPDNWEINSCLGKFCR